MRLPRLPVLPWLAIALCLWLVRTAAAADCAACTDGSLCGDHRKEEQAALDAYGKVAKDKDPKARIAALGELAKVNLSHDNHRSVAVARKVADALRDPDAEVRREAARLLGSTQEARTAAGALATLARAALEKVTKVDPKQAKDNKEYAADFDWLETLYAALAATRSRDAGPLYAAGLESANFDAVRLAAKSCTHLKTREVIGALVKALKRIVDTKQSDAGNLAWRAVSDALPKATGDKSIAPQKDAFDMHRFVREWQEWWKANEGKGDYK